MAHLLIPSPGGNVCPNPAGCACSPQAPTAPEPNGQRIEEDRREPGRDDAAASLDLASVFRPFLGPVAPTVSPPRKSPLYLRNSRLLI